MVRSVDANTLCAVLKAIEGRHELEIDYQSLKSSRKRMIAPHALALDGHRWHTRAWCAGRRVFRDFVLTRMRSVGESTSSNADPTNDVEWKRAKQPDQGPPLLAYLLGAGGPKVGVRFASEWQVRWSSIWWDEIIR